MHGRRVPVPINSNKTRGGWFSHLGKTSEMLKTRLGVYDLNVGVNDESLAF